MVIGLHEIEVIVAGLSAMTGFLIALKPIRAYITKIWNKSFGRNSVKIDSILAELKPNGGDSLRDSINRIEERQYGFDAFLTAQLNTQDVAIFRTNAAGKVIFNNRKHQRLTGFSVSEVSGDGWINVIHPEDRELVYTKWHKAVSEGREFSEDLRYIRPDGTCYLVHVSAYREMDRKGLIRGYLGVVIPYEESDCTDCSVKEQVNELMKIGDFNVR